MTDLEQNTTIFLLFFTLFVSLLIIFRIDNQKEALKQENNELKIDLEINSICNNLLNI